MLSILMNMYHNIYFDLPLLRYNYNDIKWNHYFRITLYLLKCNTSYYSQYIFILLTLFD